MNQTQLQHLASGSLSSPPSGPMPQMQVLQASQHYRVQQQQQQAGNTEAQVCLHAFACACMGALLAMMLCPMLLLVDLCNCV